MQLTALLFAAVLATGQEFGVSSTVLVIKDCPVAIAREAHVAAQEPGLLHDVAVKANDEVTEGRLIAQIDFSKTKAELRAATAKYNAATLKASDTINIEYAGASAEVAKAALEVSEAANRKVGGAVPFVQVNELRLKARETELAKRKAQLDQRIAGHEAEQAAGEKEIAEVTIAHRQVTAPLDGVVDDVKKRRGEWVQPGDEILHIVNMQMLWVNGFVLAANYNRDELLNRPVTVEFELARGQKAMVEGQVTFCDPTTLSNGSYRIRADVTNKKLTTGAWALSPGSRATMTIRLR